MLDANEAALVTDKNVCVHKFSSHEVAWELPIDAVKEVRLSCLPCPAPPLLLLSPLLSHFDPQVQVDGSKVLVLPQDGIQPGLTDPFSLASSSPPALARAVNDAGAKTAVTPMTCTDSRYAEYLGDVIR